MSVLVRRLKFDDYFSHIDWLSCGHRITRLITCDTPFNGGTPNKVKWYAE